ncbi:MAG: nitrogenase component 1 [Coriobacteriales bacterium]|jgi:nitrogenase molybdenum-iron protein alpha/beta subunit|nr:nitrogenase component 1 [Coriobacteriales bacterium]
MPIYTASTIPDSLTGAIFAIEGVADAAVVLNGPTGCKFYHSAISDSQFPRNVDYDPLSFADRCFFGQPRVPATYLDSDDYIFGSQVKLAEVLSAVATRGYGLIVVINSPGAALIGDDLKRLLADTIKDTPYFAIESTGFSGDFGVGFQTAVNRMLDELALPEAPRDLKSVNLLGISLNQKYFENNYATLRELLALCGIQVISAFGATDSLHTITQSRKAALNVVVCPESGLSTARKLKHDWGTDYLLPDQGQPIGFISTTAFIEQVCLALDADPQPAISEVERARSFAYLHLSRYSSLLGLPQGAYYSIRAQASAAYPLALWLSGYLGMIPAAIEVIEGEDGGLAGRLTDYLATIESTEVVDKPVAETPTEIIFADGDTITASRLVGQRAACIEIGYPALSYLDITRKQLYGPEGSLFLLEQIMNGLRYV